MANLTNTFAVPARHHVNQHWMSCQMFEEFSVRLYFLVIQPFTHYRRKANLPRLHATEFGHFIMKMSTLTQRLWKEPGPVLQMSRFMICTVPQRRAARED